MSEPVRVLHVDDDPDFADLTATVLERETDRLVVETAGAASEALAVLAETDVDCVVSDYDMPGKNGIEFLEAVRDTSPDLPFILFTGKGSEEVASEAISAGVTDYLQKEGGTDQYAVLANRVTNAVEHHRSERRVERSEQRLREIIDSLPHLLYVVDEGGTYLLANDALATFHGMTVDELEGRDVAEVLGDAADQFMTEMNDVLDSDTPTRVPEVELTDASGENHVFEPRLLPYDLTETDDRAVLGIAADVTERREHERELEAIRERMEHALDVTDSTIYEIDLEERTETRHGPFERLFGVHSDSVSSTDEFYDRCVHPEDRSRLERVQTGEFDGESDTVELEFRTNPDNSEVRWLYTEAYVRTSQDGTPRRLVGLDTDITERKARERERRRLKEEYENVFKHVQDSLFLADVEEAADGPAFRLRRINPANAAVLGLSSEEVRGYRIRDVFDGATGEEIVANYERCFERREPISSVETLTRDGQTRHFETTLTPVEIDGEVTQVVGVAHDITERKERERELERQNERLEEFASVVSHDLRNPLSVTSDHLELAREDCDSEHLDEMARHLARMDRLVDDLLTLAQKGDRLAEVDRVGLADVARRGWEALDASGATLVVETDAVLQTDPDRLQQLLENLFRNAVEHGGPGVTVTVDRLDDGTGFFVADDGPGVPGDALDRVFEYGYSTTQDRTWFGLAIVRDIADAHGWEVAATDGADGARFDITGVTFEE